MTISICDKSDLIKQKCQYWVGISIYRPFIQSFFVRGKIHNVHSRAGSRDADEDSDLTINFKESYLSSGFEHVPTVGRVIDFIAFMPWALLKFVH